MYGTHCDMVLVWGWGINPFNITCQGYGAQILLFIISTFNSFPLLMFSVDLKQLQHLFCFNIVFILLHFLFRQWLPHLGIICCSVLRIWFYQNILVRSANTKYFIWTHLIWKEIFSLWLWRLTLQFSKCSHGQWKNW